MASSKLRFAATRASTRPDVTRKGGTARVRRGCRTARTSGRCGRSRSSSRGRRVARERRDDGVESGRNRKRPGTADTARARHQEVSPDATATLQPLEVAALAQREAVKNKAYRAFPLGQEAAPTCGRTV